MPDSRSRTLGACPSSYTGSHIGSHIGAKPRDVPVPHRQNHQVDRRVLFIRIPHHNLDENLRKRSGLQTRHLLKLRRETRSWISQHIEVTHGRVA